MKNYFHDLSDLDQNIFRTTCAFLGGRLAEKGAIGWALELPKRAVAERTAVRELIDRMDVKEIGEPWQSAWRLIEESWDNATPNQRDEYAVFERVKNGDRSGVVLAAITALVAPRLKVEPFTPLDLAFRKSSKKVRIISDLFAVRITSGRLLSIDFLETLSPRDSSFLTSLAVTLDSKLTETLDLARRIGWDDVSMRWRLGQLYRVQYIKSNDVDGAEEDPDEHHTGIAPLVKLLHATVLQLAKFSPTDAKLFVPSWAQGRSPIHARLWASLALDDRLVSAAEASSRIVSSGDEEFWNISQFPEVALLRARRFKEFSLVSQRAVSARLIKLPPLKFWSRTEDRTRVSHERECAALLEFRRIEVCGGRLDNAARHWVDTRALDCPEVKGLSANEGFLQQGIVHFVRPDPDKKYSELVGVERLRALEAGLKATRIDWDDVPAERAGDWISVEENALALLTDLASLDDAGSHFPLVWRRLGWALASVKPDATKKTARISQATSEVIALLSRLSESVIESAIDGITSLMEAWQKQISAAPEGLVIWFRLWPIAVIATNKPPARANEQPLNTAGITNDGELPDLDTLNTPVGRLVGFFLRSCPTVKPGEAKFKKSAALGKMRSVIEATIGTSAHIVKYRLIEQMPYFLVADPDWTIEHLVRPLHDNSQVAFWRAVARQRFSVEVMKYIGSEMAHRASDKRFARETRRSFVFRVVYDCLDAFSHGRPPAVQHAQILQMLRSLDDEVRIEGADTVQRYVAGFKLSQGGFDQESAFLNAALPFLESVWPQERSLTTPGISRAFADLPATARGEFSAAVRAIQPYLVPFDCWSMIDFGLFGEEDNRAKLELVDTSEKAEACLTLLDLCLGTAESAILPSDLGDALNQIQNKAPHLASDRRFRRLSTAARR